MKISNEEKDLINAMSTLSLVIEDLVLPVEVYQILNDKLTELQVALVKFMNSLFEK